MSRVLVTGGAGFIGSHICAALLARGDSVCAIDNLDPFYDPALKEANVARLAELPGDFSLVRGDIRDEAAVQASLRGVDVLIHLAALAGVRPSIERPADYWDVNLVGTQRLLDATCGRKELRIVFASSSSVYGGNKKVPFHEDDAVNEPISPYAASKRAGELLCHAFHHLHGNSVTVLRFFTVYGPRQRPEMAIHKFTRMIENGEPIPFFGDGSSSRDYSYISDIVTGVLTATQRDHGYRIYNLGGSEQTSLAELADQIASCLGKAASIERLPDQAGDVPRTFADIRRAREELGYSPQVRISDGIKSFVTWYREARARNEVQ